MMKCESAFMRRYHLQFATALPEPSLDLAEHAVDDGADGLGRGGGG